MLPRQFAKLPIEMQNESVRLYYELLSCKRGQLFFRRILELVTASLALALLSPLLLVVAVLVRIDSPGSAIFRQTRVTELGRHFTIYKFRTMYQSEQASSLLTRSGDLRITRVGRWLRKWHLDELLQLYNILVGEMSFVGPRPELPRFVARYDSAALATLLVPAGLTATASLVFSDEGQLLDCDEGERVYTDLILPRKNCLNLQYLEHFSLCNDLNVLLKTASALVGTKGKEKPFYAE